MKKYVGSGFAPVELGLNSYKTRTGSLRLSEKYFHVVIVYDCV